jgi:hypothetical protein
MISSHNMQVFPEHQQHRVHWYGAFPPGDDIDSQDHDYPRREHDYSREDEGYRF